MTLVEAITNLTTLVTQMAQAQQQQQQQQAPGMTAEQAAQLTQATQDVSAIKEALAGLQSSQQAVISALATHSEQLTGLATQLQANGANDAKLLAAIGDLSGFGA